MVGVKEVGRGGGESVPRCLGISSLCCGIYKLFLKQISLSRRCGCLH